MIIMTHKFEGGTKSQGGMMISSVDTLKWDSKYSYNDKVFVVGDLVTKGLKSKVPKTRELAKMIEKDTKGEGLFIGFPMAFLVEKLKAEGRL